VFRRSTGSVECYGTLKRVSKRVGGQGCKWRARLRMKVLILLRRSRVEFGCSRVRCGRRREEPEYMRSRAVHGRWSGMIMGRIKRERIYRSKTELGG
jgi:hypothetical protein